MTPVTRNTRVTITLIFSMTLGAAVLMALQTPTRRWAPDALLMAERGGRIEAVTIEFLRHGDYPGVGQFDCVVWPDVESDWTPREPNPSHVRLAVCGGDEDRLSDFQAGSLLQVLGAMKQTRGLDLARVRLHPDSDDRFRPELPQAAYELRDLLLRKGIVR